MLLVYRVPKVLLVLMVQQGLKVRLVLLVQLVFKDQPDFKEILVKLVLKVSQVPRVPRAFRVQLVLME